MGDDTDNTTRPAPDPCWDAAWQWVQRQHETPLMDATAQAEFIRWLSADPRHRKAYDDASELWLLAGLVPPVNDIDIPDKPPGD